MVLLLTPGPGTVADWMGKSCAHTKHAPAEQCHVLDVVEILLSGPVLILAGGVMAAARRPEDKGPMVIDLSAWRRR